MKVTNHFIEQLTTKFIAHIQEYRVTDEMIAGFARKIMSIILEEQRTAVNGERAIQGWINIEDVKKDARKEGYEQHNLECFDHMENARKSEREKIDNEFLSKATMIVSGLKGDLWQISKKDWNNIIGRGSSFIEPGELPQGYVAVIKGKSKRVSPFNRKRV